jgi:hypothetical protein
MLSFETIHNKTNLSAKLSVTWQSSQQKKTKMIRTWTNLSAKLSATGKPFSETIRNPRANLSSETVPLDKPSSENICYKATF